LKWNKLATEGEIPCFRQQPANYFEPLWVCIDLPNEEMIFYSPYNQYKPTIDESEDCEMADAAGSLNVMVLNPGKLEMFNELSGCFVWSA